MDINKFKNLIDDFNKLPKSEKLLPTYLEISGQPHFENVCSNILAFYFNTNESHGFKDLVLKSFIECIDENLLDEYDIETINIERELYVDEQKRIDIVIECNDLVITIENKIYHILNNRLDLYVKSIKNKYHDKKEHKFFVLSLKEENPKNENFLPITYEKFFYKLKQNIGGYFVNSNNQHTTFLIDFIQTIENLTKMKTHNEKFLDFYIQNKDEILELIKENNELEDSLSKKVQGLSSLLEIYNNEESQNKVKFSNKFIWAKKSIVLEFDIEQKMVWLTIHFEFDRMTIRLYVRKNRKNNIYENDEILDRLYILKDKSSYKRDNKGRIIIQEKEIKFTEIDDEEFVFQINQIISEIRIV
jgi:hypothetical protein